MVFVSPGVFWNEIDASRYIPNLSSTIAAIVGTSTKGPTNTPTLITTVTSFTTIFGVPDPNHLATYAAVQYLRNGSQLWYIRVNGDTAVAATQSLNGATAAANVAGTTGGPFNITAAGLPVVTGTDTNATVTVVADTNQALLLSINGSAPLAVTLTPGVGVTKAAIATEINTVVAAFGATCAASGNQIVITSTVSPDGQDAHSSIQVLAVAASAYTLLGLVVSLTTGTNSNTTMIVTPVVSGVNGTPITVTLTTGSARTADQVVSDLNTQLSAGPIRAINLNGVVQLYQTVADQNDGFVLNVNRSSASVLGALATLGLPENVVFVGRGLTSPSETMTVSALSPGTWGNDLQIQITNGTAPNTFQISVIDTSSGLPTVVEIFPNLVGTLADQNLPAGLKYFLPAINGTGRVGNSKYITVTDDLTNSGFPVNGTYTLSGGDDGMESVTDGSFIGVTDGGLNTGLQLLANAEEIDVNLIFCPGIHSAPVINAMISLCETRADCMCLIDPPLGIGVEQVVDWHNGAGGYEDHAAFNSSYAALYWPWMQIFDPANNLYIWSPPSGNIASIYAYSDQVSEVWFAPAGFNRGIVQQVETLEFPCSFDDRESMYGNGNSVNPVVNFTSEGIVVYGQRTLQRDPTALDRVNVRRLMLYTRKVVTTAVKYLLWQPDDSTTWRQFVALVDPYLASVQALRGITDYSVICDQTTNTDDLIDNNQMAANIYINPTRAVEQIIINAILTPNGVAFSEVVF